MNVDVARASDPAEARTKILDGLRRYNERFLGPSRSFPLAVTAHDEAGTIVGGASGSVWNDRLVIDLVWIEEGFRGQGLGSRILRAIETEARKEGARRVDLDTFSFQAAPFYEKNGYVEVARIREYWEGIDRIYLMKTLEIL